MNLLIVIPFSADSAPQAERLLDFMYKQSSTQLGHVLLAAAPDCHAELRKRIHISAEMVFKGVHELDLRPLTDQQAPKVAQVNSMFRQVAQHVQDCFTWPFLLLEPDCVPMHGSALQELWDTYNAQPREYMGARMKAMTNENEEQFFMARTGLYPNNAYSQLFKPEIVKAPFEIVAGEIVIPRFTPTKLIQQLRILTKDDLSKVRTDVILVHGDKNGHLLRKLEEEMKAAEVNPKVGIPGETNQWTKVTLAIDKVEDAKPESVTIKSEHAPLADPFTKPMETIVVPTVIKKRGRPSKMEIAARKAALTNSNSAMHKSL